MCGIVGAVSVNQDVVPVIMAGLQRLEYRGYDSAGIAVLNNGNLERRRASGKLTNLQAQLAQAPISGMLGIGHTRWATHGAPNEANAHPHLGSGVAIVHNGIIENYQALKTELQTAGVEFTSDTDSEVFAHLFAQHLKKQKDALAAFQLALKQLHGAFSLAVIAADAPQHLFAVRQGTPLVLGRGDGGYYTASDASALAGIARELCYLEDGDYAMLTPDSAQLFNKDDVPLNRPWRPSTMNAVTLTKGPYRHFMHKEIHEQPEVLGNTINYYIHPTTGALTLPDMPFDWAKLQRLTITACGTAYYAGLLAKYWFESIAKLPVEVEIASEWRYRDPTFPQPGALLAISQSGETLDTLEAVKLAKAHGYPTLAVCNVEESTIARTVDSTLYTLAGPEIGVASTKAFTTQLTVLACLVLSAAEARGAISKAELQAHTAALREVPAKMAQVLQHEHAIETIAHDFAATRDVLYLGRGTAFPIALEGALKLKEISYIHAEAYPAGELKHGPIALIDEHVPVVIIAPPSGWLPKTMSNVQEVHARGGKLCLLADHATLAQSEVPVKWEIELPDCDPWIAPILYTVPVQLLAYHVAVAKGTDVDQPRNLAKAVTVE